MNKVNNIFKNVLCLLIAVLISLMELQFFDNNYSLIIGVIIFILTIPTIYLYFLPKHETMILFLYCIILVYLLDFLGKELNIYLFLSSLFSIVILFTHSLYTSNARRTRLKTPKYTNYLLIIFIILLIVSLATFFIYEYILKPNVNDQNKLALVYENKENRQEDIENIVEEEVDNNSGGGGGGSEVEEPIDWIKILKYLLLFIYLCLLFYILYKYFKYRRWLSKTKKLNPNLQAIEVYKYFLNSLAILDLSRNKGQTPIEYLTIRENENFPFSSEEFTSLTNSFIKAKYSNEEVSQDEGERNLLYFYSISKSIRKKIGFKNYIFRYLLKI